MKAQTFKSILVSLLILAVGWIAYNKGIEQERTSRKAHIRNLAEARTIDYNRTRLQRARLPLTQYVFAELRDYLNK